MSRDAIPYELEGMVSTVTVLRLLTDDLASVQKALRNKIEQMPGFFQDAAVAVDLSVLEGTDDDAEEDPPRARREIPLQKIVTMLRELKLVPVGIRYLREARRAEARAAGLGMLRGSSRKPTRSVPKDPNVAAKPVDDARAQDERRSGNERRVDGPMPAPIVVPPSTLILRTPLRSGQVVYAEQCDAVVLSHVNAGAELIADGNIHVYASLRGRALAGAHGNEEARIFCKSLEADLVAIAGCYLRSDEIPENRRGKPAQIYLEKGQLVIADL
ncbi:MAG: septum site-determining protein MinC [Myxococcales bacterium]